jgi:hypothetical protein
MIGVFVFLGNVVFSLLFWKKYNNIQKLLILEINAHHICNGSLPLNLMVFSSQFDGIDN